MKARYWLAAMLLAAPVAGLQSPVVQAQQGDAYAALVETFVGSSDNEAALQAVIRQTGDAFLASDPVLAELDAQNPGLWDRVLSAMTPMVREHSQGATAQFQNDFADLLRRNLTPAEAREANAFYGSPLGQRVLASANANFRQDRLIAEAVAEREAVEISESAVAADVQRNTANAVEALSDADLAEIGRQLTGKSWVMKFQSLMPQMIALRASAENTPMDPNLQARMQAAIVDVIRSATGAQQRRK